MISRRRLALAREALTLLVMTPLQRDEHFKVFPLREEAAMRRGLNRPQELNAWALMTVVAWRRQEWEAGRMSDKEYRK